MYFFYSVFIFFFRIILGTLSLFDSKIRRGIEGRKSLFQIIEKHYSTISPLRKRILIHVSSFGELEQAKPVIAAIKEKYPEAHIHLTFFSPSGYDNAIDTYKLPDIITYLPLDSQGDVEWFLDIVKPHLVLFVRYDLWHNFVHELHDRNIPMLLFSATFDSSFGKSLPFLRSLYNKTYSFMNTICTVSEADKNIITKFAAHAKDIIVAGDTRCDQVIARKNAVDESKEQTLPENILQKITSENLRVVVAGSTWENDEVIIVPILMKALSAGEKLFVIIAPHEIGKAHIASLLSQLGSQAIVLSKISSYRDEKIIIIDSIGKLFALYQFASFSYVGGGFGSGVHNVLEPAVWGVPTIVGPNHKRSKEISALIGLGAAVEVQNRDEFEQAMGHWFTTDMARLIASASAKSYVTSSAGATEKIMEKIGLLQW